MEARRGVGQDGAGSGCVVDCIDHDDNGEGGEGSGGQLGDCSPSKCPNTRKMATSMPKLKMSAMISHVQDLMALGLRASVLLSHRSCRSEGKIELCR